MTILDDQWELLTTKLSQVESGEEKGLAAIFGEDWENIGTSGKKREFGRLFKQAVKSGIIVDFEWVRIENSGRFDVYRKK